MSKYSWYASFLLLLFLNSCSNDTAQISTKVDDYYHTMNERNDFEKFLSFYDEEVVLEDIINGDQIEGKTKLKDFFDWENPGFTKLDSNSLVIEQKIMNGNHAVVKGYFTAFKWGENVYESMHFTTLLTFNKEHKIIKHVDWINYPSSLVNYNQRKNSNEWIE